MSKLTWKDLKGNNIVIHTPTEDIMKLVVNTGIEVLDIEDYLYEDCNEGYAFYVYGEDSCVRLSDHGWGFGSEQLYRNEDYEIVEYGDVRHLFKDYIDTTETKEIKYLAKIKLKNGEEGYFMEEWDQGEHWLSPVEEFKYADMYTNLTSLKEILDIYKEEIEEYKIIKQTTTTTKTFEFVKQLKGENNNER